MRPLRKPERLALQKKSVSHCTTLRIAFHPMPMHSKQMRTALMKTIWGSPRASPVKTKAIANKSNAPPNAPRHFSGMFPTEAV
jgi:hypothetical protein